MLFSNPFVKFRVCNQLLHNRLQIGLTAQSLQHTACPYRANVRQNELGGGDASQQEKTWNPQDHHESFKEMLQS